MQTLHRTFFTLAALGALTVATVGAQTPPTSPSASPAPSPSATSTASPTPTAQPKHTNGSAHSTANRFKGKTKHEHTAKLSMGQIHFAMTHARQEADRLKRMHTISFSKLRIVRVSGLNTSNAESLQIIAQTTLPSSNGSNSPIQYLQYVLANINVSNALNDTLNNSNVNVVVPLTDVLNNDNISIGQVVGVYVDSAGLIYTIAG